MINELEIVRVVRLNGAAEDHLWPDPGLRPPAIGEEGVVVAVLRTAEGEVGYAVEFVNCEGRTEWLANFVGEELTVVEEW